jgi:quercetin dioxygenase-like cupin family protein
LAGWFGLLMIIMMENTMKPKDAEGKMEPALENDRVRVLKVTFKPGDTAARHHHPDHVIYVVNGGKLKLTVDGKTDNLDLKTGEAVFLNEQWHEVENIGESTVDLVVVELK